MKCSILVFLLFINPVFLLANDNTKKKILMVVSSYGKAQGKLRPGYEFEEFSQAYLIFKANGFEVEVASPKGGYAEPDGYNKNKPYNKLVVEDAVAMSLIQNTKPTALINPAHYSAIYIVGGKGAMFDLPFDPSLQEIIQTMYEKQNAVVAAVCHGPAVFVNIKNEKGDFFVKGKKVGGFSNTEEKKFGKTWITEFPFLLEDKLKERGANYQQGEAMLPHVSVDGKLLTGQNPFSTTALAEEIVKALGVQPAKRELYKDERSLHFVKRYLNGEAAWAEQEIKSNTSMYDTELIAVYGYYKVLKSNDDISEIKDGLRVIELVTPWVYNDNLQFEKARGYLKLNDKEKAKELLNVLLKKSPAHEEGKKLLSEIK